MGLCAHRLIAPVLIAAALAGCQATPRWVSFAVRDAGTGQPVPNAKLELSLGQSPPGFKGMPITLTTDERGSTSVICMATEVLSYSVRIDAEGYAAVACRTPVLDENFPNSQWLTSGCVYPANQREVELRVDIQEE